MNESHITPLPTYSQCQLLKTSCWHFHGNKKKNKKITRLPSSTHQTEKQILLFCNTMNQCCFSVPIIMSKWILLQQMWINMWINTLVTALTMHFDLQFKCEQKENACLSTTKKNQYCRQKKKKMYLQCFQFGLFFIHFHLLV